MQEHLVQCLGSEGIRCPWCPEGFQSTEPASLVENRPTQTQRRIPALHTVLPRHTHTYTHTQTHKDRHAHSPWSVHTNMHQRLCMDTFSHHNCTSWNIQPPYLPHTHAQKEHTHPLTLLSLVCSESIKESSPHEITNIIQYVLCLHLCSKLIFITFTMFCQRWHHA